MRCSPLEADSRILNMKVEYAARFGTIGEIARGEGKALKSSEDIASIDSGEGILVVPRTVGIYQIGGVGGVGINALNLQTGETRFVAEIEDESFFDPESQKILEITRGRADEVHPGLITVLYDSKIMTGDIVRMGLQGDVARRVHVAEYVGVPNYIHKRLVNKRDIRDAIEVLSKKGDGFEEAKRKLGRYSEIFKESRRLYGLTRVEAANQIAVETFLSRLRGESELRTGALDLAMGDIAVHLGRIYDILTRD